ncbi:MAG: cupredoxin domain-containing protein [Burkholderiales bacterium]
MKLLLFVLALCPAIALSQVPEFKLSIRDHRFLPAEVRVPANMKVKLIVANEDATPEEFDSYDLNREKVIVGKSSATIYVGPLGPGRYAFKGEFNSSTAQGVIVVE